MKKKINIQLMTIAGIAIISTLLLLSVVFYNLFQKQVLSDLKVDAHILKCAYETDLTLEDQLEHTYDATEDNLRITVINEDGTVEYDSLADAKTMENHKDRQEVKDALASGFGEAIRRSTTVDKNTYYYAILLSSGQVLRVSKETDNMFSIFFHAMPILLGVAILLFLLCILLTHLLTKRLIAPIDEVALNIDQLDHVKVYKELLPFVKTIHHQHEEIIKSANIRSEFTANVSHELKTPLTSISGYAELLENDMVSKEDIPHFASEIHKNANRLLALINDILRLSQLDGEMPEITFEQIDLYQVAQNTVNDLQINAEKLSVNLSMTGTPCKVCANRQMLEELIYNLCDNAIRYNYKGGTVRVSVTPVKDAVILAVQDTGIGISKENQKRIFERFYRVDKSRSKATGGTGLGLAIVKHIVAQHNAQLTLESELGKGTDIRIKFV